MPFFKRLFGSTEPPVSAEVSGPVTVLEGVAPLRVVGERGEEEERIFDDMLVSSDPSPYQDVLWAAAGVPRGSPVQREVTAILLPGGEGVSGPVSVWLGGRRAGVLTGEDAEMLRPGLVALGQRLGHAVGLRGRLVGCLPGTLTFGGDGVGSLTLTLLYSPADFGLPALSESGTAWDEGLARSAALSVSRPGRGGMPWGDGLPSAWPERVPYLRALLEQGRYDLVDRHFMFNFLEEALYKQRDASPSALPQFDEVCERHHLEMVRGMRAALLK